MQKYITWYTSWSGTLPESFLPGVGIVYPASPKWTRFREDLFGQLFDENLLMHLVLVTKLLEGMQQSGPLRDKSIFHFFIVRRGNKNPYLHSLTFFFSETIQVWAGSVWIDFRKHVQPKVFQRKKESVWLLAKQVCLECLCFANVISVLGFNTVELFLPPLASLQGCEFYKMWLSS